MKNILLLIALNISIFNIKAQCWDSIHIETNVLDDLVELQFTALKNFSNINGLLNLDNNVLESIGGINNSEMKYLVLNNSYGFKNDINDRFTNQSISEKLPFGFDKFELVVIPNPSSYDVGFKVLAPIKGSYKINILDTNGKEIYITDIFFEKGLNSSKINSFKKNKSGIYYFKIAAPSGQILAGNLIRI